MGCFCPNKRNEEEIIMFNLMNLLTSNSAPIPGSHALFGVYKTLSIILVVLMAVAALAAVILVLLTHPFTGNFSENPDAIQKAADSVVKIYMYDYNGILQGSGSGFATLDEDIIITNHHCIYKMIIFVVH